MGFEFRNLSRLFRSQAILFNGVKETLELLNQVISVVEGNDHTPAAIANLSGIALQRSRPLLQALRPAINGAATEIDESLR